MSRRFVEPQYNFLNKTPEIKLGLMSAGTWYKDPRRLAFVLSRYKFVAKMLVGKERVVEIGCGDAFGSRIVQQEVNQLTVTDIDHLFVDDIHSRKQQNDLWPLIAMQHDILSGPLNPVFDAAFSLDVLEHISTENECLYLENMRDSVKERGVIIIGIPSLESQPYGSQESIEGHVNCKRGPDLKLFCEDFFSQVFLFSMNDEVVHTGYAPMAQYLFAVCVK